MFDSFSHIMIYVNDVDRAARWYCEMLGFSVRFLAAPHYGSVSLERIGLRVDLHPDRTGGNVGHGAVFYFAADDLDAAIAALRAKGIAVPEARVEGNSRFTDFHDSEGNVLGLCKTESP